jgi:uncharacterized damage-inducible protein DinB
VKNTLRAFMFAALVTGTAAPSAAQAPANLKSDLLKSVTEAEQKFVGLAETFSAEQYDWRPAEGVRSVREVLLHVAADNYFLPAALGIAAPAATKITATEFAAVQAFEKRNLDRAATVAELKASFEHLREAIEGISDDRMSEGIKFFGQDFTVRRVLLAATTHMHEHLGQSIAYARMNGVKPPWSR